MSAMFALALQARPRLPSYCMFHPALHPMPPRGPPPGDLMQSPIWLRCQWMLCGTEPLACSTIVPSHEHVHDVQFSSDVSTTRVRRL